MSVASLETDRNTEKPFCPRNNNSRKDGSGSQCPRHSAAQNQSTFDCRSRFPNRPVIGTPCRYTTMPEFYCPVHILVHSEAVTSESLGCPHIQLSESRGRLRWHVGRTVHRHRMTPKSGRSSVQPYTIGPSERGGRSIEYRSNRAH